jgi:hypothetical protein
MVPRGGGHRGSGASRRGFAVFYGTKCERARISHCNDRSGSDAKADVDAGLTASRNSRAVRLNRPGSRTESPTRRKTCPSASCHVEKSSSKTRDPSGSATGPRNCSLFAYAVADFGRGKTSTGHLGSAVSAGVPGRTSRTGRAPTIPVVMSLRKASQRSRSDHAATSIWHADTSVGRNTPAQRALSPYRAMHMRASSRKAPESGAARSESRAWNRGPS